MIIPQGSRSESGFDSIRELLHRRYRAGSKQALWGIIGLAAFYGGAKVVPSAGYDFSLRFILDALVTLAALVIILYASVYADNLFDDATSYRDWVGTSTVVMLAAAFVAAFMLTAIDKRPLPTTTLMRKTEITGKPHTHTDGFWCLYPDEGEQKGRLIAIPDDKVKALSVHSRDE